jgi:hypothetical protein
MREENRIAHGVWVGDRLSLLERLTISLFQRHGHEFHLWSYVPLENVPEGTVMRDAAEVMPKDSVFRFEGIPNELIPNGGIGSLSHWSDQFQCKLLNQEGGLYTQMDIAIFAPLDFEAPYMFVRHKEDSIAPVIMKVPRDSKFSESCYQELSSAIDAESIKTMHWDGSMQLIMDVARKFELERPEYFVSDEEYWDLGSRKKGPFYDSRQPQEGIRIMHWSNATNHVYKDRPIRGSFYAKLLQEVGLIRRNDPALQWPSIRQMRRNLIRK